MNSESDRLREQIEHLFASAWQDGVNHLNPKYLRRDTLFADTVMQLINKARIEAYADCGSKAGSGTVVRSYAKSRANGLDPTNNNEGDKS